LLLSWLFCLSAWTAPVEIVFYERQDSLGSPVTLLKGGRFFHVALKWQGCYLHTDVYRGVVCDPEVSASYGVPAVTLVHEDIAWNFELIDEMMGKPYDGAYEWGGDKLYCSEMIALLFNLTPSPMRFDGNFWQGRDPASLPRNKPGISPDEAFAALKALGFREVCESLLILN
jgi:hypothetical protein